MSARRVWALSQGEYSDYSVIALFTTKKLAEEAAGLNNSDRWSRAFVEEFVLYDETVETVDEYKIMQDIWDADALIPEPTVTHTVKMPWAFWDGEPPKRAKVRWVRAPIHQGKGGRLEVRGRDRDAVVKAYTDNAARIIAGDRQKQEYYA